MDNKTALVVSIVNFLKKEIECSNIDEDGKEGLEVAMQCLETTYNLEVIENRETYPDLLELFNATKAKNNQNQPKLPTDEEKIQAEQYKVEGNNQMKSDQLLKAVECYSEAINLDPTNAVYYSNRAAAYTKLNENIKALADCQKAISIDPNYGKAYGRMGLVYLNDRNFEKAFKMYEKAVELEPGNASYKNYLNIAKENLESTNSRQTEGGAAGGGNPLGNFDLNNLLSNPAVMNLAQNFMQNPQMQNMFANFMGSAAAAGGAVAEGSQSNASTAQGTTQDQSQQPNSGFQMPQGLDFSNIMGATRQFAEQMRQENPELVENLRSQFEQGAAGQQNPSSNKNNEPHEGYS